jgi:hypothetical protein
MLVGWLVGWLAGWLLFIHEQDWAAATKKERAV